MMIVRGVHMVRLHRWPLGMASLCLKRIALFLVDVESDVVVFVHGVSRYFSYIVG